jgi:hypothetical protein
MAATDKLFVGLEAATEACARAVALRFGNGPVRGRIRAHVITAIR